MFVNFALKGTPGDIFHNTEKVLNEKRIFFLGDPPFYLKEIDKKKSTRFLRLKFRGTNFDKIMNIQTI